MFSPDAYDAMMSALRRFQHRATGSVPAADLAARVTATLDALSDELEPAVVAEPRQMAGRLVQFTGRAQALIPPLVFDAATENELTARLTAGRYYQGRGPALHGGVIPLIFDEFLGILMEFPGRPAVRTAYLKVDYRALTPPDTELLLTGRIERIEGRKRYVTGTLHAGSTLCAEADALFVEPRPQGAA